MPWAALTPATRTLALIEAVPKSARWVRKQFVAEVHSSGRSMIHSAEVRLQLAHVAVWVTLCLWPAVRSATVRVNLPLLKLTEVLMVSPGNTVNTLTEPAGNISYHAL